MTFIYTSALAYTLVWYLGALALLWYVSMRYCEGATLSRTIPPGLISILMLIPASGIYYEYTDSPIFRAMYFLWAGVLVWIVVTALRAERASHL